MDALATEIQYDEIPSLEEIKHRLQPSSEIEKTLEHTKNAMQLGIIRGNNDSTNTIMSILSKISAELQKLQEQEERKVLQRYQYKLSCPFLEFDQM